ncbi:MAG: hypothetical protein N3D85_05690 [Candidatus Bathyarchaeota archaeon]|nr:hypothetical protein [Candidatus Bathyarchaeota archaeon]
MDERLLDEILATDKRIRYVGIVNDKLENLMVKARAGLELILDKCEAEEKLVMLAGPIILGTLEKFSDKLGNLVCAGARFKRLSLIFLKVDGMNIVISTDPVPPYSIMKKLENKLLTIVEK